MSASASATAGPGATLQAPPAATTRSGGGQRVDGRGRLDEASEGGAGGRHAEQRAVPGGVAPRRERELAQAVAHPQPVERER